MFKHLLKTNVLKLKYHNIKLLSYKRKMDSVSSEEVIY